MLACIKTGADTPRALDGCVKLHSRLMAQTFITGRAGYCRSLVGVEVHSLLY